MCENLTINIPVDFTDDPDNLRIDKNSSCYISLNNKNRIKKLKDHLKCANKKIHNQKNTIKDLKTRYQHKINYYILRANDLQRVIDLTKNKK